MSAAMTPDVARQLSFFGKGKKNSFSELKLKQVVFGKSHVVVDFINNIFKCLQCRQSATKCSDGKVLVCNL
jgi:hypothetical protein